MKKRIPEDEPLLQLARKRIEELNEKYRDPKADTFFLFHRPRRWNPRERIWMGYERKRGKLAELNALLRGGASDRFSLIVGGSGRLIERQVRDHPGHGYATPARFGVAVCGGHGAPA